MKEYRLKTAQSGLAAGPAFCVKDRRKAADSKALDAESEITRFDTAVSSLDQELAAAAAKTGGEAAAIFEMEAELLEDKKIAGAIRDLIKREGWSAEAAAEKIGTDLAKELEENSNEYIRQRNEDMRGMMGRLLDLLSGEEQQILSEPSVIVARELSPAQLSAMDGTLIRGIVTEKGAPTSHVSILAGNLGIPYLYGSEEAVAAVQEGDRLILRDGSMLLAPEEADYQAAIDEMESRKEEQKTKRQDAADTPTETKVYANIAGAQDIEALLASGAEGVGLFRSEFLFLDRPSEPDEEEQFQAYRAVAEAMGEKETVIRTMDLGSDKMADWMRLPEEKNPALGCRGLRVSLKEERLSKIQLRALLRAAAFGNVKIMVPMVASPWEVDAMRTQIETCAKELEQEGKPYRIPPLGIMVETPAAAVTADLLAEKVDFFSIGTNDLTQYTLALDREAENLDQYYDPCHEAVMRLIRMTAAAGHEKNIPTAICGELAGNPDAIKKLIASGVDELSVSISKVEATRAHVVEAEEQLAQEQAERVEQAEQGEHAKGTEQAARSALAAPADGKLIPMQDIPDPAFASGTLGECVGILPDSGDIYAPCDGVVSGVAETKHAITFTSDNGQTVLVHVGIDTVNLGGKGFTVLVSEGETVTKGQKVMETDLDVIREANLSPMVIIASGF